ncbi:MAG: radical SAM family heme chaperone HemW [Clostridiales bacterium]|nr:radical SAM family heme chaperone HemW [Clostridiales bacterium]
MSRHIYIHIPFCEAKCPYCDFYSRTDIDNRFFDAALKEIDSYSMLLGRSVSDQNDTLYIGGGTPSSVDASYIASLVQRCREVFSLSGESEITIEVNPHSVTPGKMQVYKECGINRISVGVQSLHDDVLQTLGRLHDCGTALSTVADAVSFFGNVSADLMLGIPGQTPAMLLEDADILAGLGVKHISMYSLTLAEDTPFYSRYKDTLEDLVPDEREMYHGLRDHLADLGLHPYEISNCAFRGFESRHNMSCWRGEEYFAVGPSSHGYLNGRRFSHRPSVGSYIRDPLDTVTEEILSDEDKMREYAMLMLRTADGISRKEFLERFGSELDEIYKDEIESNIAKGCLEDTGRNVRLTSNGLDLANQVFADFL